jgi:hypothetical protein
MGKKGWTKGNRAFYWDIKKTYPLCLQSKDYNGDQESWTWVYYSKKDAGRLLKFLETVLKDENNG